MLGIACCTLLTKIMDLKWYNLQDITIKYISYGLLMEKCRLDMNWVMG